MAGDMADDVLDAAIEMEYDVISVKRSLREDCPMEPCQQSLFWNDDGLLECKHCGRMTDI